jgi:ribosome-binding factor A
VLQITTTSHQPPTNSHGFNMDEHRSLRVSEAIKEEISEIVGFELSDPRLISVDVTGVAVTPDSRHAIIKVSLGTEQQEQKAAMAALEHAKNYLRHQLASRLNLRRIPELHFEPDYFPDAATRVEILLKRAKKKRESTENRP